MKRGSGSRKVSRYDIQVAYTEQAAVALRGGQTDERMSEKGVSEKGVRDTFQK